MLCVNTVTCIKDYPCLDELWVIYGMLESPYCTLETTITLYVNWNYNNKEKKYLLLKLNVILLKYPKYVTFFFIIII